MCEPLNDPVDGVPAMPLTSGVERFTTSCRPSPQLTSYVNDSAPSPPLDASSTLSGLSKPGSEKLMLKLTDPASRILVVLVARPESCGFTFSTTMVNVRVTNDAMSSSFTVTETVYVPLSAYVCDAPGNVAVVGPMNGTAWNSVSASASVGLPSPQLI